MFIQPRFISVKKIALVTIAAIACATAIVPAQAGMFDDSEARQAILDLRTRTSALESQMATAQRAQMDQATQIDQLNQQLDDLRGQNETLTQKLTGMQTNLKDYYADLHGRMGKLETPASSVKAATDASSSSENNSEAATKQTDPAPSNTATPEETEAFNQALVRFRHGDFKGAELAFRNFIQAYPKAVDQPNAQYWLGNALYAQRKYTLSTPVLLGVAKNYPTHPRASEALLAVAQNQIEQKQNKQARQTLGRLLAQYPNSASAKTAKKWIKQIH